MISLPQVVPLSFVSNDFLTNNNINLSVLRLDTVHTEISGNKMYKLHYFIKNCLQTNHKTILTFGGAYSNHLAATAYCCKINGLKCIGIIRGEQPTLLSHTMQTCIQNGMKLHFVNREQYKNYADPSFLKQLEMQYGNFTLVPEGGFDKLGVKGASHIMSLLEQYKPTHVCTSVGTATTLAGLLLSKNDAQIIAVPAIKNMTDVEDRIAKLAVQFDKSKLNIINDYHFGGYAKYNDELIHFMNHFYKQYQIPTDIVYTSKLMYGIMDKIEKGFFNNGSKIICLHTGGLQGNKSLPKNTLTF